MMNTQKIQRVAIAALALTASAMLCACGQPDLKPARNADDPGNLGTPQQRMQALQNNPNIPPAFKARLMGHLQEQANGTHEFGLKKPQ